MRHKKDYSDCHFGITRATVPFIPAMFWVVDKDWMLISCSRAYDKDGMSSKRVIHVMNAVGGKAAFVERLYLMGPNLSEIINDCRNIHEKRVKLEKMKAAGQVFTSIADKEIDDIVNDELSKK